MAAYAAAISVLDPLSSLVESNHQFSNIRNYRESEILALFFLVCDLKDFLEKNPEIKSDFESQIRDVICEAEDIIDFHISEAEIRLSFYAHSERVMQKIKTILKMTAKEFNHLTLDRQIRCLSWRENIDSSKKECPIIGRDEDVTRLKDRLLTGYEGLEVVPIVGSRGMGKTALARYLFDDLSIREHFETRCWVKLPNEYYKRNVLLDLLRSMRRLDDGFCHMNDDQLVKHVYNILKNKSYLVVLDDIHDAMIWNDLKEAFPDYNNGGRILLTTRIVDAAPALPHLLHRLSDAHIFTLIDLIVFHGSEFCPIELCKFAIYIVECCRGLPLAGVIVGKLLACAQLSVENWKTVLYSIISCENDDDLIEAVVSLTYRHLPQYLKPCLLFMAMFPFGYDFAISKLTNMLVAERFFQRYQVSGLLDGYALNYLNAISDRGIAQIHFKDHGFKFRINEEVLHEFIARKAKEENFFAVIDKDTNYGSLQGNNTHNQQRQLCIRKNIQHFIKDMSDNNSYASVSTVRSLLFMGPEHQYPLWSWLDFKLLKVLNALKIRFYTFPAEILKLFRLRYLALSYNGELPAAVCKLWELQILIVSRFLSVKQTGVPSYLPMEIWNMKELRHLDIMGSDLPDPPSDTNLLLEKIFTLSNVGARSCTPCILQRLRKLYRLRILIESLEQDESSLSFFSHLEILEELQTFKCVVLYPSDQVVPSPIPPFPSSLWKLSLSGCGFSWEYMRVIAILPNLRILKLRNYAFRGPEWKVKENEFPSLQCLLLEDLDLESWTLADSSFPRLEWLIIRHFYKLKKIPSEFADITTLKEIEVEGCSPSVMESAQQIDKKRKDLKRSRVRVDLYSSLDD